MAKKELRLRKIPLEAFLDALLELYNEGLDYIDLVGTPDSKQDTLSILFTRDYMSKEMRERFEDVGEDFDNVDDQEISKNIDLSNDEDLNQLI
jgi:hypothetical protein